VGTSSDPAPARPPGDTIFAVMYGDEGQQNFWDLALDQDANAYVVGNENTNLVEHLMPDGSRTFGPQQGTLNGLFVLKFDGSGSVRWKQPFTLGSTQDLTNLVAVATQPTTGAVIVAGLLEGSLTVGNQTLTSGTDPRLNFPATNLFLMALDTAGYVVWSRIYQSPAFAEPDRVFVAANGDIEVVGRASDNATVGGAPLCCRNTSLGSNTFIARYTPTGDHLWSTAITGDFFYVGSGADPAGDVAVGGDLSGTMAFQGQTLTGGGLTPDGAFEVTEAIAVRVDGAGHAAWIKNYPSATDSTTAASLNAAGEVILYGTAVGTLDLGNGVSFTSVSLNNEQPDSFLAKLAADGTAMWVHPFASNGFDQVQLESVASDAAGNIAASGAIAGGLNVGGAPLLPAGTPGKFVAKFGGDGTFMWSRGFPITTSNDATRRLGLAFDGAGEMSWAGEFDDTVDFGTGPLTPPGLPTSGSSALPLVPDNIFVARFAP
jgi:hypothetical protein